MIEARLQVSVNVVNGCSGVLLSRCNNLTCSVLNNSWLACFTPTACHWPSFHTRCWSATCQGSSLPRAQFLM